MPPAKSLISASSNFTMLLLVSIDALGIAILFNLSHWMIAGDLAPDLLLTWKLSLILGLTFLYFYLMDLYTFDSPFGQLGMLERSFIAIVLTGISVALLVYIIGPGFIGGFVGRGVLAASLLMVWIWSLSFRYIANLWFVEQRSQIHWLVIVDDNPSQFLQDFRKDFQAETVLLLTKDGQLPELSEPLVGANTQLAGSWDNFDEVISTTPVSGVIVTSLERVPNELVDRLMNIRIHGTRIYRLSDFYEQYLSRVPIFHLSQQWLTTAHGFELIHNRLGLRFKRYVDVLIALVGGLLALPLIIATVLLIFVSSGRPIFYRQTRTGENNEPFVCYKFRTMVKDAEADGIQFAAVDDPRVIPFGRWLRKYRLDELPQLWNVLRGDMSFIGPRPERPEFIQNLAQQIPFYNLRHTVKPGITGWAQVMYGYGDTESDAAQKLQYDLFYIKNYSLLLDISIL
ncbi:MAG: exopolysaccharide biosynthesis polyprenyl glycosylphosphotransferase, partial [Candidatus Azotimanducaceae bacterium]